MSASKNTIQSIYTNDLHEALMAIRDKSFWKCCRSKFDTKNKRIMQVNGLINDSDIVNNFESFFRQVCSKHTEEGSDELKVQYTRVRVTHCGVPQRTMYLVLN